MVKYTFVINKNEDLDNYIVKLNDGNMQCENQNSYVGTFAQHD